MWQYLTVFDESFLSLFSFNGVIMLISAVNVYEQFCVFTPGIAVRKCFVYEYLTDFSINQIYR